MEKKSVYAIVYSSTSTKESDDAPYIECKGVYADEDTASGELMDQFNMIMDIYDDYNIFEDFEIKQEVNYWSINNLRDNRIIACRIQEVEIR